MRIVKVNMATDLFEGTILRKKTIAVKEGDRPWQMVSDSNTVSVIYY